MITDPNKFIAKMGAEALHDFKQEIDLDSLSYELRHKANTETSQQRKNEALKKRLRLLRHSVINREWRTVLSG